MTADADRRAFAIDAMAERRKAEAGGDPDHAQRLALARGTVEAYGGGSEEEAITDAIADLIHLATALDLDADFIVERARRHVASEVPS